MSPRDSNRSFNFSYSLPPGFAWRKLVHKESVIARPLPRVAQEGIATDFGMPNSTIRLKIRQASAPRPRPDIIKASSSHLNSPSQNLVLPNFPLCSSTLSLGPHFALDPPTIDPLIGPSLETTPLKPNQLKDWVYSGMSQRHNHKRWITHACILIFVCACRSTPPLPILGIQSWPDGWEQRYNFEGPGVIVFATTDKNAKAGVEHYLDMLDDLSPYLPAPEGLGALFVVGSGEDWTEARVELLYHRLLFTMQKGPEQNIDEAWQAFRTPEEEREPDAATKIKMACLPIDAEELGRLAGLEGERSPLWAITLPTKAVTKRATRIHMDHVLEEKGSNLLLRSLMPLAMPRALSTLRRSGHARMLLYAAYPDLAEEELEPISSSLMWPE